MQCELFEFSDEDFDTGISDIDNVEVEGAFQYELQMPPFVDGDETYYLVGEDVQQLFDDYILNGEVTSWNPDTRMLKIAHTGATDGMYHEWATDRPVVGPNASMTPVSQDEGVNEIQVDAQNKIFNDWEEDFLDFSESNPFGDII
jgi:hypothetical protein